MDTTVDVHFVQHRLSIHTSDNHRDVRRQVLWSIKWAFPNIMLLEEDPT
jgi:hypothetical protein